MRPCPRTSKIQINPNLDGVTVADLQARFDLAIEIRDRVSEANEAVILARDIKGEVEDRLEQTDEAEIVTQAADRRREHHDGGVRDLSDPEPEQSGSAQLSHQAQQQAGCLVEPGGRLRDAADGPVSGKCSRYLSSLLDEELQQLDIVINRDLGRLNELLQP